MTMFRAENIVGIAALFAAFLIGWNTHKYIINAEASESKIRAEALAKESMQWYIDSTKDISDEIIQNIELSRHDEDGAVAPVITSYFNRLHRR